MILFVSTYLTNNTMDCTEPTIRPRNYAPDRLFVTKWDVEINNNRIKDKSRRRERFNKYFTEVDDFPIVQAMIVAVQSYIADTKRKLDDDIYEPRKRSRI